ncbi:response regulator transcription factor [Azospirillum sp. TSO22-1]|uniref:response regulator transcription factor n=1 Tax=Azospirillum sp. TSO22-1 TaxID=716789 RepID=UPI000D614AA7|nr:response regulator transcription factor [Azospirillum sp. TSO22-1]PWC35550.1 transcriptional regulator [Azospirillum sp. TSO22-1]
MSKILIADDHPMVRDALRSAVGYTCQAEQVFEAGCLDDAVRLLGEQGDMDLLLLDINMPGMNGLSGLVNLRNQFPATPVVVVSAHEDRKLVREVIQCGAAGFIPKSTPRDGIAAALRLVMEGGVYVPDLPGEDEPEDGETAEIARRLATLTPQQMRVLEMLGTGKLNKEIAYELSITETTVKAHVSAILQKLKVYSRTQAVVFANRLQMEQARTHF